MSQQGLNLVTLTHNLLLQAFKPHPHEVIQNPISEDGRVMSVKFFSDTDGTSPEVIIKVTLGKVNLRPAPLIKLLSPGKDYPMYHVGGNLEKC